MVFQLLFLMRNPATAAGRRAITERKVPPVAGVVCAEVTPKTCVVPAVGLTVSFVSTQSMDASDELFAPSVALTEFVMQYGCFSFGKRFSDVTWVVISNSWVSCFSIFPRIKVRVLFVGSKLPGPAIKWRN